MSNHRKEYRTGSLPERFPLATALTPMQESAEPIYDSGEALARGTLFPGLDLPFMGIVNPELPSTPLAELMAIDFVAHELVLYLDTHEEDQEAFEMLQTFLALAKEARRRYTEQCGPVKHSDLLSADRFSWLCNPWPWDYNGRREG